MTTTVPSWLLRPTSSSSSGPLLLSIWKVCLQYVQLRWPCVPGPERVRERLSNNTARENAPRLPLPPFGASSGSRLKRGTDTECQRLSDVQVCYWPYSPIRTEERHLRADAPIHSPTPSPPARPSSHIHPTAPAPVFVAERRVQTVLQWQIGRTVLQERNESSATQRPLSYTARRYPRTPRVRRR